MDEFNIKEYEETLDKNGLIFDGKGMEGDADDDK